MMILRERFYEYSDMKPAASFSDLVMPFRCQSACPKAEVIAEAIAAFLHNNRNRERLGEAELDSMIIPSITMIGTRPIFYEIKQLSEAVATAQYPPLPTIVKKCVVASTSCRPSEGIKL